MHQRALQRHFDLSPKCRRCGSVTSLDLAVTHPFRATLEHLYKAGDPRREQTKGLPVVARTTLFCYRCNITDGHRYGEIVGSIRTLAQEEAKALASLVGEELLFGGYISSENVSKVKAVLVSRFVSKEYLSRIKKTVNETDRIEQETARIGTLLDTHRDWLYAQPDVVTISVGVRASSQVRLCVGGSLSPKVRQAIRDKIGEDVYFEEIAAGDVAIKGPPFEHAALSD